MNNMDNTTKNRNTVKMRLLKLFLSLETNLHIIDIATKTPHDFWNFKTFITICRFFVNLADKLPPPLHLYNKRKRK